MIEFEIQSASGISQQPIMLSVDTIGHLEPSGDLCLVKLKSGRELLARHTYAAIRALIIGARSGFATAYTESIA